MSSLVDFAGMDGCTTSAPGIQVSELLPRLARQAHLYAVVRTVHHRQTQHNSGMYWSIVGRPYRLDSTLINPSPADYPSFGTLVGWLAQRDGYSGPLPPYVITPAPHCDSTVYITPGQFGGCLGARYDPLVLHADPNAPNFKVPNVGLAEGLTTQRLQERESLLGQLDGGPPRLPIPTPDFDINRAKAFHLVNSAEVQKAFDLSREPSAVREAYGQPARTDPRAPGGARAGEQAGSFGQGCLMARRLVEAGVPFVEVVMGDGVGWDTHRDNFPRTRACLPRKSIS